MINLAQQYSNGYIQGWAGPELAKEQFDILAARGVFHNFQIQRPPYPQPEPSPRTGKKMFLYEVVRKVLGKDTQNYRQEIGDCVSFGMKNAIEYLECVEILLKGEAEKFQNIFPPYIYGTSRNQIGGGRINGDGSLGSWAAESVKQFGVISSIDQGVPPYNGNLAKQWGSRSGVPSEFLTIGKKHLVRAVAPITSVEALCDAICNGYACTVASNQGFAEQPDSKGFHRAQGNWAHQMCIIGIDMEYTEPYVLILNSWGDVHGKLKSFYDDTELPVGVLRARISEIERTMIKGGDSEVFAPSQHDGYPEQRIDKALFRIL